MILNYDKIVMDIRDYEKIVNPKNCTLLNEQKAEILLKLNKFNLIEKIAYEEKLRNIRVFIHKRAERDIGLMLEDFDVNEPKETEFYQLAVSTHEEYDKHLDRTIEAVNCLADKKTYDVLAIKQIKVCERIKQLQNNKIND